MLDIPLAVEAAGGPGSGRHGDARALPGARGRRLRAPAATVAALLTALAVLAAGASPALAVDGWLDLRATRQEGRLGPDGYETEIVQSEGRLSERVDFSRALYLQVRYGALREATWSTVGGLSSELETRTQQPNAILSLRAGAVRLGLTLDGYRRDYEGAGLEGRRDDRAAFGGWSQATWRALRLQARWLETRTWRADDLGVDDSDTRERAGTAGARLTLPSGGETAYADTENEHRDRDTGNRNRTRQHALEYRDSVRPGPGLRLAWDARASRFDQLLAGPLAGGRRYLPPVEAGFLLDDTPAELDPLEPGLIRVPALADNDRIAATTINVGDSAPPVREFGGDFRNIQFDFGESQELGVAALYVDRIVLFPQFILWRLYVSDDPEGRLWSELPAGAATVAYREWDASLRGWEIVFTQPVAARHFKLVDEKSGPTQADLFVTELEVYDRSQAASLESRDRLHRYRLDAELAWTARPGLDVRYLLSLDERRYDAGERNLSGLGHTGTVSWRRGLWSAGGSAAWQRRRGASRRDTDVRVWGLNVTRGRGTRVASTLAWSRQDDRSRDAPRVTDSYLLQNSWDVAPLLNWTQKLIHSRVDDPAYGDGSRAWTLDSRLRATPRPSLGVDLSLTERWVDSEAGAGFSRYTDAEGQFTWTPRPLLTLSSLARYQMRGRSDWLLRHLLAWTPAPGGSVDLRLSLTDYDDQRSGIEQSGAGASLVWRPRARLLVEAGVEKGRFEREGQESWPLNLTGRANWTF